MVWLRQQLDEDDRVARAATAGPWSVTDNRCVVDAGGPQSELRGYVVCSVGAYARSVPTEQDAEHIALHDPARVLREVEAKRLILDEHPRCNCHEGCTACTTCGDGSIWPCDTVRLLALPYSGRPGYREEWKP